MSSRLQITLKQRVLRAGGWSIAGYAFSQVIRFGSNLVMTRLLVPEMFGVMAIATMIMYGLALISDVGLRQNVVQSGRGNDVVFLNTAWTIQILRGVLLWFFALGASFLVFVANRNGFFPEGSVYAEPNLPYVIAILSASTVISGFNSTKIFESGRNLSLYRITKIDIASQITGLIAMFFWVAFDRSIWALVAGSLCSCLMSLILSHVSLPGVANRWQWDDAAFREIIQFGKWIFLSSILGFLINSGDRLMLGGLVSATVLGVYTIAFFIFSAVEQALAKIITDVAFPAFSEIVREQPSEMKAKYYRFHLVISSFSHFCAGILIVSGQALIALLYDKRYTQAGWILEILSVALLIVPFRLAPYCFMALGMPRLLSNILVIRLATMFILMPVGFHLFGLQGVMWGIVFSHFSILPQTLYYKVKYGLFDLQKELLVLPMVLIGVIMGNAFNWAIGY